ncbi:MAG TPA: TRAM domain-containing protein [Acidimicrobiales bacterium]|nr:TRAM domain-containing protein [Acidimicrobiales bacterium]
MLFVEGARMLFVLVGVAVGYRAGTHWTNPNLDNLPAIGAVAGALIAYVTGGWLGRALRRLTGTVSGSVSHIPPYEILAGALGATVGALVGLTFGVALVLVLPRMIGLALAAMLVWVTGWAGGSVALSRAEELFAAAGLSLRPLVRSTPYAGADGYVVDTSSIMDPGMLVMIRSGLLTSDLLVPRFVLDELRALADEIGTERGRRAQAGLETLEMIRREHLARLQILEDAMVEFDEVDAKLVGLARRLQLRILTTDNHLSSVAELQGVPCLNIRTVVSDMASPVVAGSELQLTIVKPGKSEGQGVAYLDDGSMVVVAGGEELVGEDVSVVITNVLPTSKGRLYFAHRVPDQSDHGTFLAG